MHNANRNIYVKSSITYELVKNILNTLHKTNIIFYIDLASVCKGLYNKNNVFNEINYYIENKRPSDQLVNEYRDYLNLLHKRFRGFNPKFVTFFDDGQNSQNLSIQSSYKSGRSSLADIIDKDEDLYLFKQLKKRYWGEIEQKCSIKGHGVVYNLHEYESDLIPYYVIKNNFYESGEEHTLNVVISNDKDLLQCCQFTNTIQFTNRFMPSQTGNKRLAIDCWDNNSAIEYIYKKFKRGALTSKHIVLLLALAGDKADGINGIKNVGPKKAIDLILNYNIPIDPLILKNELQNMPDIIKTNITTIVENIKMISFEEQLKRIKITKREM